MIKMLKIVAMLLVITTVVFAAGCAGKTTENKNETKGAAVTSENGTEKTLTAEVPNENVTENITENLN
jgi:inhibitor of cysteine peptidase